MICLFIFKKWFCLMLALIKCSTANFGNTVLSTYGSNFGAATEPLRLRWVLHWFRLRNVKKSTEGWRKQRGYIRVSKHWTEISTKLLANVNVLIVHGKGHWVWKRTLFFKRNICGWTTKCFKRSFFCDHKYHTFQVYDLYLVRPNKTHITGKQKTTKKHFFILLE